MSSTVSLPNMGSIGLATQEQLDFVTSKFPPQPKSIKQQYLEDIETLTHLNVTAKQIADKCELLFLKAMNLLYRSSEKDKIPVSATIDGKFKVSGFAIRTQCSPIPCPFTIEAGHPCGHGNAQFTIENLATGETITTSTLQLHIIRDHVFFARTGTPARIDPAVAARVLDIRTGVNYSAEILQRPVWKPVTATDCPDAHKKNLETSHIEKVAIDAFTTAYLMKSRHVKTDPKSVSENHFSWGEFLVPLDEIKHEADDQTVREDEQFLHIVGGNEGFMENPSVFGRRIHSLFCEKNHLSVLKASEEKFAIAGDDDQLEFFELPSFDLLIPCGKK